MAFEVLKPWAPPVGNLLVTVTMHIRSTTAVPRVLHCHQATVITSVHGQARKWARDTIKQSAAMGVQDMLEDCVLEDFVSHSFDLSTKTTSILRLQCSASWCNCFLQIALLYPFWSWAC